MTIRRLIACILLPCYLVACTSWKTQEVSPQQVLTDEQPDKVRVSLTDGSQVVLEEPVVSGDTLIGFEQDVQKSILLADVSALELREGDGGKTTLAIIGGVILAGGLALGVAYAVYCAGDESC